MTTYHYKSFVLESLGCHGMVPKSTTAPVHVRGFLNDLYRYELRKLRERYMQRQFSKAEYHQHVIDVRKRYPLMSYPVELWTE